jgi:hypothetical protein
MIRGHQHNCQWCAHYSGERRCEAFPAGIPEPLWLAEHLHRTPFEGDQGLRYEPRRLDMPDAEAFLGGGYAA